MTNLPPERSFGHVIRDLNRALQKELADRIAKHGISLGQWYALRVLWLQDGLSQAEIAQRSGHAAPNVVAAMRTLAAKGLIVRERHPTDQRKNLIFLTRKGRQLEVPCLDEATEVNRRALSRMSSSEIEKCMTFLRQAKQCIDGAAAAAAAPTEPDISEATGTD